MGSDDSWTIVPRKGLGALRFGMSPAQVDTLSGTYGALTGRMNDRIPDAVLIDTLEKFGDALSDEEKQSLIAVYEETGPSADSVTETRGEPGLVLGYRSDRLVEIMPARDQRPLFLDGRDVFALPGMEPLVLLEQLNGGPGRYSGTEAAFDALAVSVDGFCVTDPAAGVRALDEADERYLERTVMLREEPYRPEGEMGRFAVHWLPG